MPATDESLISSFVEGNMSNAQIAGYTSGTNEAARSTVSKQELDLLKQTELYAGLASPHP